MSKERRKHERVDYVSPATIELPDGSYWPCIVFNLSRGGAMIGSLPISDIADTFVLHFCRSRSTPKECDIVWRSRTAIGVKFAVPLEHDPHPIDYREQATETV